jgi:beta-phosphoglucomutase-like phosphatase (HAD superfamily)
LEKLIIWDFDGVVADTERLWLQMELEVFNKYCGLNWDFETINHYLAGQAFNRQLEVLHGLGIYPSDEAMREIGERCYQLIDKGFDRMEGIDDVLALPNYKHAMGTGGDMAETVLKIRAVGLEHIFTPDNVITIDFVKKGKPAPDTFLLAAEVMGFEPKDCIVIEDSIAGLQAAIAAGMEPICFAGSLMYRDNETHLKAVRDLGVNKIFKSMAELKAYLA